MEMNTWNILLVDDEVDFIITLAERLELRGVNVRVVHDGARRSDIFFSRLNKNHIVR